MNVRDEVKAGKRIENCLDCPSPSLYIAYLSGVIGPFNVPGECRWRTPLRFMVFFFCFVFFSNKTAEQIVADRRKSDG